MKIQNFLKEHAKTLGMIAVVLVMLGGTVKAASGFLFNVEHVENLNVTTSGEMALGSAAFPDCANADNLTGCPSTGGDQLFEGAVEIDGVLFTDGGITSSGGLTSSGVVTTTGRLDVDQLSYGTGSLTISTSDTARTLTAAEVCDNSVIVVEPLGGVLTISVPATSTLHSDCLTELGATREIFFSNDSDVTSTIFATHATSTELWFTSTSTIAATGGSIVNLKRFTDEESAFSMITITSDN